MRRQQHRHPAGRTGAQLVAQQVAGFGRPVGQRGRGQLDAFAGGVVVVGDARADRVGAQHGVQNRCAEVHRISRSVDAFRVVCACGQNRRRRGSLGVRVRGGRQLGAAVAEARARSGVVVAQHHADGARRHRCIGDDGQPAEFLGDGFGAHVIGLGGLHLAAGHVRGIIVADLAGTESLGGQHF